MKRIILSAVKPWKTRYTVHWMSPDGKDCLLAGSNTLEGAVQSGINQVEELLDSPWETDERRLLFLENMYIAEGDRVIDTELDDYVDGVMSMISSRMKMKKQSTNASTEAKAATAADSRKYVIQVSDNMNHIIGYVKALSRSRHINTLYVDIDASSAKIYDSAARARSGADIYSQFDEIYQYDGQEFLGSYYMQKGVDDGNRHFVDSVKVEAVVYDDQITSATDIEAWSTYEPSASEYGDMMDSFYKRLKERYKPFTVKPVYFSSSLVNHTGYRITLDIEGTEDEYGPRDDFYYEEWILDGKESSYSDNCKLYGPFDPGDITKWSQLRPGTEIGKFKNLDQAMTWLFKNVDYPDKD